MRRAGPLLCLAASIAGAVPDSTVPRGVGPEFAKFYKDRETFTCISNPSIKIPFAQVNDDFCDCPDGSDEPGTAACSYLSTLSPSSPADTRIVDTINATLALPGFYCPNKGHVPAYVPFTAVNDGICDYDICCDGADESSGIVACENKCAAIGKAARQKARERQKTLAEAGRKRKELVNEAAKLKLEVQDSIKATESKIKGLEVKVQDAQKTLEETELRERSKVVKGASGPLGTLVQQAKDRMNELRESLVRVRSERDAARTRLAELESLLSTFKEEYNPNYNDEGVKRAVRSWEDYVARDKEPDPVAALDRDLDEITKSDEDAGLEWDQFLETDETSNPELDLLYSFEAYLPAPARTWLDGKLRSLRQWLIDNGVLFSRDTPHVGHAESRAVTDARNALRSAESDLAKARSTLETSQTALTADYGAPDEVYRPLKGRCISLDSGEFNYELCFLDKVTQKSKKGGGGTNLGHFAGFEEVEVDDGTAIVKKKAMRYDRGQHCWNGPARSTLVVLSCAEDSVVTKVTEEEKCVYRMEVGTPAACEPEAVVGPQARDEL